MKNLIRFSLVISGAVILGAMLLWLVDMRQTNAVAADQPVLPNPTATQGKPWQRIRPPVAISETQILLQTIILDVNLEKMAEIGIDFETSQASPSPASTKQPPGQFSIVNPREARLFAKLLVSNGVAKILAEPTMVTKDGRPANFRSGGEFPLLVPQAEDKVAIEFREFGTSIEFLPKKLAGGKLRLEICLEQADLDQSKSIEVNGTKIPGLKIRQVDTVLELQAGKTAMLRDKQLFVIVTPEFVAPPAKVDILPQLPQQVREIPFQGGMDVSMLQGQSVILGFENKIRALRLGNDGVIDAQPTAPNLVRVNAKQAGRTILVLVDEAGELQEIPINVVAKALPAPQRPTGAAAISLKALVYTVDPKKAQDDGVDLYRTLSESAALAKTLAAAPEGDSAKPVVSVIGPRTLETLTRRLSQTKGAQVLSRPQIHTLSGQPGRVEVASRVQLPSSSDVQQATGRFQDVGIFLDVIPIVKGDLVHLEVRADHSQLQGEKVESISLLGSADLYPGETLVICQKDQEDEQLLLLVTPTAIDQGVSASSPARLPRVNPHPEQKTEEAQRKLAEARLDKNQQVKPTKTRTGEPRDLQTVLDELFPDKNIKTYPLSGNVVLIGTADPRTAERVIRVAEVFYPSVISHLNEAGTLPQTSRNRPSETTDEVTRDTLPNQLRELRQDVKVLRGSVSQLIDLLQEQVDKTQPQEPPSIDSESSDTPATEPVAVIWETIGIRAEPTDFDGGSRYRGGLKILEVRPESPAAKEGMRLGDVLVGLDRWETLESKNVVFALDQLKENHSDQLKFYLLRGNETLFGHLKLAPHPNLKSDSAENNALTSPVGEPTSFWGLSLDAVIDIALQNSKVTRNLIGVTLDSDSNVILLESNANLDINQFEVAAKKLVGDVEEAYWELWLADRELETARAARDSAQELWSDIKERQLNGDESKLEVQLRQEYFACRAQTDASLKKLHGSERSLRFLIGLASSDGRLIQATDKPATSPLKVVRKEALANALAKAPELRQQRSTIRSIELQLKAAKNILLPTITIDPELVTGETLPETGLSIGTRKRLAQVRNLELRFAHEKARLEEMEAGVSESVTDSVQRLELAFVSLQTRANQQRTAQDNAESAAKVFREGGTDLGLLLLANRRLFQNTLDSDSAIRQYVIAIKNVRFLQGSWLKNREGRVMEVTSGASGPSSGQSFDEAMSAHIPDPTIDLKPNDRLTIESLADKNLNRDVTILADGTITLPLLGQVAAAGRTLEKQRQELESLYKKYYRKPELTLSFYGTSTPVHGIPVKEDGADGSVLGHSESAPDPTAGLQPGDRLLLESLVEERLTRKITILRDGTVTLPLLGQVPAAGRTLATLNKQLTEQYKKYFTQPEVTVSFLGTSSPSQ